MIFDGRMGTVEVAKWLVVDVDGGESSIELGNAVGIESVRCCDF